MISFSAIVRSSTTENSLRSTLASTVLSASTVPIPRAPSCTDRRRPTPQTSPTGSAENSAKSSPRLSRPKSQTPSTPARPFLAQWLASFANVSGASRQGFARPGDPWGARHKSPGQAPSGCALPARCRQYAQTIFAYRSWWLLWGADVGWGHYSPILFFCTVLVDDVMIPGMRPSAGECRWCGYVAWDEKKPTPVVAWDQRFHPWDGSGGKHCRRG